MEFPDRAEIERLIDTQPLPSFARVRQEPPAEAVPDPPALTRSELDRLDTSGLEPGATVAVGVGSRGISDIGDITAVTVEWLNDQGFDPVIVPAMGSHGGATPEGQRDVLHSLGITEPRVGAPIDARLETERVGGVTVGGTTMPVYVSTAALEADGVVVLNRVKPHTNFTGPIESGLVKMAVVGLGKQRGANAFHATAIEEGYVETLEPAFEAILNSVPILGGVAIVENSREETAHVEAIPAEAFTDREPKLLERAREEMATLPVEEIDLLVVDEIGKEISGTGMDTNVTGRYRVLNTDDPPQPDIKRIYVRGLTEDTEGNGMGIGIADVTRRSTVEQLDLRKTYANALTSGSLAKARLPVVAPDDELAVRIALSAIGRYDPETVRIVWISNTQDLEELRVSEPLIDELPDESTVTARERLTFQDGTARFESG